MEMVKKKFFSKISKIVADMEGELIATREQVEKIKSANGLSQVHPQLKREFEELFRITSGRYSFEEEES